MSALSDKIFAYNPEQYFRFNETFAGNPTNLGSGGQFNEFQFSGQNIDFDPNGGPDGEGSWKFYESSLLRSEFQTNVLHDTEFNDLDYTIGIWVKPSPSIFHDSSAYDFYTFFIVAGQAFGAIKPRLYTDIDFDNGQFLTNYTDAAGQIGDTTTGNINDGNWHYIAARTFVTNPSNNTVRREFYIDGILKTYSVNSGFPTTTNGTTIFGNVENDSWPPNSYIEMAHYHVTSSSSIESTAISEIYNIGINPPLQVSFNAQPATATALQTEPTIVAVIADNVYITTTFVANAILPVNVNVSNASNFNFVAPVFSATAEHPNNVNVATGFNSSFTALAAEATADLIKPFLAEQPILVSAQMGNAIASVEFSYYKLIKDKNPYIYIYNGSKTNPVNDGYGNNTITFGDIDGGQDGGVPINLLGNGLSWFSDGTLATIHNIRFNAASQEDSFLPIQQTGNWAAEVWVKSATYENATFIDTPAGIVHGRRGTSAPYGFDVQVWLRDSNDPSQATSPFKSVSKPLAQNEWNHIVFQQEEQTPGAYQYQLWVNGALLWTASPQDGPISFNDATGRRAYPISDFQDSEPYLAYGYSNPDYDVSYGGIYGNYNMYVDEIAYYDRALSSAEITYHYEYVTLSSPDSFVYPFPMFGDVNFLGGSFFVTTNVNHQQIALTGYADFVLPSVTPGISKNISAEPFFVSSELLEPDILFDSEVSAEIITAFAESGIPIFLNNIYAQYIIANYSPYRYANFDSADVLQDLGSDADYSLPQIEYSGTVSEPGYGINNKSILTSGTYYTDGVKLLESEFDDTWGTGIDHHHSSFWMRRSILDQSTTGLRVLWNLNGAYDNQHVILYQYQGNLKIQFNNGSGTYIEDSVAMDLFDYERHFIAINFDHTGSNIFVEVFVDGALAMSTDLGQYAGETINGIVPIGPNDPAANKPRLGVGCLITPFVDTALPIIPTNTRLYVDEVVWSKTHFELSDATALYNIMPAQTLVIVTADPLTASGEVVNPGIIVERSTNVDAAFANAELLEPNIIVELNNEFAADVMTATAEINDANASQTVTINSDVMVASALLIESLVSDFVVAAPMTATTEILQNMGIIYDPGLKSGRLFTIYFNEFPDEYVEYLVKLNSFKSIPPFREVK